MHSQELPLKMQHSPHDPTRLVSRSCHAGTVANVSRKNGNRTGCRGKLKDPTVKQNSFELERREEKVFHADCKMRQIGYSFLTLEGKIEQQMQI